MQSKLIIILIFSASVFGLTYNQNSDCAVNFVDFAMMAADYNDTVDINDIAGLTGEWLEYETTDANRSPVVADQSGILLAGTSGTYTITATDDESPLTYSIIAVSEPNAGDVNGLTGYPYSLASNEFTFDSNALYEGMVYIIYAADDGTGLYCPCGGIGTGTLALTINQLPTPPTATASDANVLAYVMQELTLTATDDGEPNVPGRLRYIITDLPDDPNTYLQDPKSGAGIIDANNLPYTLSSSGNVVRYYADTAGLDSFQWKANDYGTDANSGDSNVVTIDVNVIANPKDSLYFDGTGGTVEFADSNYFDLMAVSDGSGGYTGQAFDFWIKTYGRPYQGICKKRQADGKGWELNMIGGKAQLELYDANGLIFKAKSALRLDNGNWNELSIYFMFDVNGTSLHIASGIGYYFKDGGGWITGGTPEAFVLPDYNDSPLTFANDANLVFGSTSYGNFKGCIDKLRTFVGITEPAGLSDILQGLSPRTEDADEVVLGFGRASTVLYMFDEASGTSLDPNDGTNRVDTGLGTINDPDKILWQPRLETLYDATVKQYYETMEKRKCIDNGI